MTGSPSLGVWRGAALYVGALVGPGLLLVPALTMGTMNVYMGDSARLTAALARDRAIPARLGTGRERSVPRQPLVVLSVTTPVLLLALSAGLSSTTSLVRASSACFVAVYLLALAAGASICEVEAECLLRAA